MKLTIVGVIFGVAAVLLTLLLLDETSPYYQYFLLNETIPDLWRLVNFPILIVLMLTKIDYRPFAFFLFFLQWFLLGSFVFWVLRRFPTKRRHDPMK